jgi:hypothetical protein
MYKAVKPKESEGWADIEDSKGRHICFCYSSGGGLKMARRIARLLNAQEKKDKSPK